MRLCTAIYEHVLRGMCIVHVSGVRMCIYAYVCMCIKVFHNNTFSSNDLGVLAIGDHYGENYPDFFLELFDLIFIAAQPIIEND